MSKSSYQHDRDGVAVDALRTIFPKYWLYKNPRDMYSGKEYSEDLIIEIVNDDAKRTVTSIEFGIQNKTDLEIRNRHVTVMLDIDDIERLRGLPRQILIHALDVTSDTSYWLWLSEWYESNSDKFIHAKRKQQKQIALKIPKKNILDARAVEKIHAYLTWEHHKQKVKETAGIVARQYSKDYAVRIIEDDFSITTVLDPKHEAAVPIVEALDESANEAMIRALETGKPTPLIGSFTISNSPKLILENMGKELVDAWLIPLVPLNHPVPLKIEFLDMEGGIILKSSHLLLQLIQPGTVISVWRGVDEGKHITYTITFDRKAVLTNYSIDFGRPSGKVQELSAYYKMLDSLSDFVRLRITNLQTEEVKEQIFSDLPQRTYSPQEQAVRRMAYALNIINEALMISLEIPNQFTAEHIDRAEWIAEAIKDGEVKVKGAEFIPDGMVLICTDPAVNARKLLHHFESDGKVDLELVGSTGGMSIEILGQTLDLGLARWAVGNAKILNVEEIKSELAKPEITDESSITTVFDVDREQVFIKFVDWPQKSEENK